MRTKHMEFLAGIITGLVICIVITAVVFYFDDKEGEREEQAEQAEDMQDQEQKSTETVIDDWENSDQLIKSRDWGGDDSYRLAQVAMWYARNEDEETKMLVVLVCLNNVWTQAQDGEQTSIEKVADEMTGRYYRQMQPSDECFDAVGRVQYEGWDESQGALYFTEAWDERADEEQYNEGHEYLFTSGEYAFYK